MSTQGKERALWVALGIIAAFVLIVIVVDQYEKQLRQINWPLVSIICCFALAGWAVYQWNASPGRYDLMDLVMNPKTGKADPYRHLMFVFAGLGAWAVVQVVLAKEWATLTPLLALLLGYFVAKPTIDGFADALAVRRTPPDNAPPPDGTT